MSVQADALVRTETADDYPAIRRVNEEAFGGTEEADLVDALRAEDLVLLSSVAVVRVRLKADTTMGLADSDSTIAGHIMFSRMWIESDEQSIPAVALAPLAVLPAWQRQGVGGLLIRDGLDRLRRACERVVIVVGHPEYYPRFGFCRPDPPAIEHPFPAEAFMAMALPPHTMDGVRGRVRYPPAFGL